MLITACGRKVGAAFTRLPAGGHVQRQQQQLQLRRQLVLASLPGHLHSEHAAATPEHALHHGAPHLGSGMVADDWTMGMGHLLLLLTQSTRRSTTWTSAAPTTRIDEAVHSLLQLPHRGLQRAHALVQQRLERAARPKVDLPRQRDRRSQGVRCSSETAAASGEAAQTPSSRPSAP